MILGILGKVFYVCIGFVIGVFVYRNNESTFSPIADKADEVWDEKGLEDKIEELKDKLKDLKK